MYVLYDSVRAWRRFFLPSVDAALACATLADFLATGALAILDGTVR